MNPGDFRIKHVSMRGKTFALEFTVNRDKFILFYLYFIGSEKPTLWPVGSFMADFEKHQNLINKCLMPHFDLLRTCTEKDIGKIIPGNQSILTLMKLL